MAARIAPQHPCPVERRRGRPGNSHRSIFMKKGLGRKSFLALTLACTMLATACGKSESGNATAAADGDAIKVGILHSLSGTMANSEDPVKNSKIGRASCRERVWQYRVVSVVGIS